MRASDGPMHRRSQMNTIYIFSEKRIVVYQLETTPKIDFARVSLYTHIKIFALKQIVVKVKFLAPKLTKSAFTIKIMTPAFCLKLKMKMKISLILNFSIAQKRTKWWN